MTAVLGDPALRRLARLKLRGTLRKHGRRLRTWKGALLTVLGVGIFAVWILSVVIHSAFGAGPAADPDRMRALVGLGALALTVVSLSSAFVHRGLYLPGEEIERLFSAPVARPDVVRYRLLANIARGAFGGTILGLLLMRRMPLPAAGFLGVFLAVQTLPVAHQLAAILAGRLEQGVARRMRTLRTLAIVVVLGGFLALFPVFLGEDLEPGTLPLIGPLLARLPGGDAGLFEHPAIRAATLPFEPWVRAITAPSPGAFVPWFAVCLAIWVVLVEVTARLPIDYRELSLETSASVAARLRRARRGGGAAAGRASRRSVGWRIPWVFGRGPAGALAWRKLVAIVRKARGTLTVSSLVLVFVTVLSTVVAGGGASLAGPLLIAALGTLYLCAGLRFDLRDELDHMEVVKAWPVPSTRLFAAMLLPEVFLVSLLLIGAVLLRGILDGALHPGVALIVAFLPLGVFGWVALDNAAFLFAPVRFVPGQEGALQNAGRGMLMMLVRLLALAAVGLLCGLPAWLAHGLGAEVLGWSERASVLAGALVGWGMLFVMDLALVGIGGLLLRRFDVARDRG